MAQNPTTTQIVRPCPDGHIPIRNAGFSDERGPGFDKSIEGPKINLGHQEVTRAMDVAEEIYFSTPLEWLAQDPIAKYMCTELGYEDVDELEDALGGTFDEFCGSIPNFSRRVRPDSDPPVNEFKVERPPQPSDWVHKRHTIKITNRDDLWRVVMKVPDATVTIPEMEFDIGADRKRNTDTIFNMIGTAVFNLGQWVQEHQSLPESTINRVSETILELNSLLDVDRPWTFVVDDPRGYCQFLPMTGVETEVICVPTETPAPPTETPQAA